MSSMSILRFPSVKEKTGIPHSTLYLKISKGEFPKPIKLGVRSVGWIEQEIDDWVEKQIRLSREAETNKQKSAA